MCRDILIVVRSGIGNPLFSLILESHCNGPRYNGIWRFDLMSNVYSKRYKHIDKDELGVDR